MAENFENQELNLDTKVTVKNLAGWTVGFARLADGVGDVNIVANGTARLSRNEIIAQCQSDNKLFSGTDGQGSHATLYIDDKPTRIEVGYENADGSLKQNILTDDKVKELFAQKSQANFERTLMTEIHTRAEKYALMQSIKRLKINDYSKIRFSERYTGYTLQ